ncbi:hypothetical protein [Arenibaculum sp.]|jgi:hypothetical protein|uniref:hypothetical protein n=1 Tax=Arenibaculum sp. TaxID=2865862 RepID=UPI002E146676|nr:hypothetical protein [Arenibaculum sp.]
MRRFLFSLLLAVVSSASAAGATELRAGSIVYRIVEVDWQDRLEFRDVVYETEDAFLVVRLAVRNDGTAVAVVKPPKVVHSEHGAVEASWKRWVLPLSFDRFEAVAPGSEKVFTLAFEVERDDGYRLLEAGGGEVELLSDRPAAGDPMV